MIRGARISANALVPRMRAQEIISNNIANLHNDGFRRERLAFHTLYGRAVQGGGNALWPEQVVKASPDDTPAAIYPTGSALDFAIDGPGLFVVATERGERYTRSGSFHLDPTGKLVTSSGHAVQGQGGEITLPPGNVSTAADGSIVVDGATVDRLRVVVIEPDSLAREGANTFRLAGSGAQQEAPAGTRIVGGHLEHANVEPVLELVEMLRVFREYETNYRAMNVQGDTVKRLIEQQLR